MQPLPLTATVEQVIAWAEQQFSQSDLYYGHGTDNPLDEAYYLVFASLGLSFDADEEVLQGQLKPEQHAVIVDRVQQRIELRIPVAYLVNKAWFAGLMFYINEHVLIPRSPIAELIQDNFSPWIRQEQVKHILDIGTGSGCIAIACAQAFPYAQVDAVDISLDAMSVAERNVSHYQLEQRVNVIESDVFSALAGKRYDIIVSNPPYVPDSEYQDLPEEYNHEPGNALLANTEGMHIIELILQQAYAHLNDGGILVVEVGNTQHTVIEHYPHLPFVWLEFTQGGHGVFLLHKSDIQK